MSEYTYISATDAAKYVRAALKRAFPGAKFSVRTRDATEIVVGWVDGPSVPMVKTIVERYRGGSLDGMIDLAYNWLSWLNPTTGEAAFAYTAGTYGNGGSDPPAQALNPWPDVGILVSFGSKYTVYNRRYSRAAIEKAIAGVVQEYGVPAPEIAHYAAGTEWDTWEAVLDPCRDSWEAHKFSEAIPAYDAYEPPADRGKAVTVYEPTTASDDHDGIEVRHERDWTWAYFTAVEPGDCLKAALLSAGAKASAKRARTSGAVSAWYIKERIDLDGLLAAIQAAYWRDYKVAHPEARFTDPAEPLGPGGGPSYGADRAAVVRADWRNAQPLVLSW